LANVSIATVSRTINGVPTVDKELADRVWKAIRGLNYYPNVQARSLVSGRSRIFGLLISDITNPFFPELIQGFENVAIENGYDIMISSTNHNLARMESCVRRLLERNVEGVAVMTFGKKNPFIEEFTSRNLPLVFVDYAPDNPQASALKVNYREGIQQAMQYLATLGHTEIAFISGPLEESTCQLRKEAFLASIEQLQIPVRPDLILGGTHRLEGGMEAAARLLERKHLPTAIMCSNDMTAIGVLRTLTLQGIRVPEDVSVIGFDDIHLSEFVYPPLTTVHMSRNEIARAAFNALRSTVEDSPDDRKVIADIPTHLTIRSSAGPARGARTNLGLRRTLKKGTAKAS
jgi:LacI family transcriptional regulator